MYSHGYNPVIENLITHHHMDSVQFNICKQVLKSYVSCNDLNMVCTKLTDKMPTQGRSAQRHGLLFNFLVEHILSSIRLTDEYELKFERVPPNTSIPVTIPDWYILHKPSGRLLVGNNKLDLWSGGQQSQVGESYVSSSDYGYTGGVCKHVVCILRSYTHRLESLTMFDRLFYPNQLPKLISDYFMITGLGRKGSDQYYTKPDVSILCINHIHKYINHDSYIIEPSAGSGSISNILIDRYGVQESLRWILILNTLLSVEWITWNGTHLREVTT